MARVTVEDCIEKVNNRFELVLMASRRAKDIERGATPSVARNNDKPTIIALREIAEEAISLPGLQELTKRGLIEDKNLFAANSSETQENFLDRDDNDAGEEYEGDRDLEEQDLTEADLHIEGLDDEEPVDEDSEEV